MMKKVLVLMMVLGLASAASAGIVLTVNGVVAGDTVVAAAGDVLTIGLSLDAGSLLMGGDFQFGGGTVGLGSVTQPATYPAAAPGGEASPFTLPASSVAALTTTAAINVVSLGGTSFNIVGLTALFDGVQITVGAVGDIFTVSAFSDIAAMTTTGTENLYGAGAGIDTLTIVPEPMTLALLGLGGLFIRRRK